MSVPKAEADSKELLLAQPQKVRAPQSMALPACFGLNCCKEPFASDHLRVKIAPVTTETQLARLPGSSRLDGITSGPSLHPSQSTAAVSDKGRAAGTIARVGGRHFAPAITQIVMRL